MTRSIPGSQPAAGEGDQARRRGPRPRRRPAGRAIATPRSRSTTRRGGRGSRSSVATIAGRGSFLGPDRRPRPRAGRRAGCRRRRRPRSRRRSSRRSPARRVDPGEAAQRPPPGGKSLALGIEQAEAEGLGQPRARRRWWRCRRCPGSRGGPRRRSRRGATRPCRRGRRGSGRGDRAGPGPAPRPRPSPGPRSLPSPSRPNAASRPARPAGRSPRLRGMGPPVAATRASTVPSPPSAIGARSISTEWGRPISLGRAPVTPRPVA